MVADLTSIVNYSRAGQGGSQPDTINLRTPQRIAEDLRALLSAIGAPPPYILVGHSMGGLYVRTFAGLYPSDVAGLVLVDGTHERQGLEVAAVDSSGRVRPPAFQGAAALEWEGFAETRRTGILPAGPLPDVPMVVITSARTELGPIPNGGKDIWRRLHSELFGATTHGMHIMTRRSSHLIPLDQPGLVLDAIEWVLDAVRSEAPRASGG
jgi:pimeloyl-ACP methyl ester carboxylesterase